MKKTVLTMTLFTCVGAADAEVLSWNTISMGLHSADFVNWNFIEANSLNLQTSLAIKKDYFIRAGFGNYSFSKTYPSLDYQGEVSDVTIDFDYRTFNIDAGYRHAYNQTTEIYAFFSLRDVDMDMAVAGGPFDSPYLPEGLLDFEDIVNTTTYGFGAGARKIVYENLELGADIGYYDLTSYSLAVTVYGTYHFAPMFSGTLSYKNDAIMKGPYVGINYHF